jgi:hypothetical protein
MSEPTPELQREPTRKSFPNQQNVRPDGSPPGRPPEGTGGSTAGPTQLPTTQAAESEKLPGTHAGLDALADERGLEWSRSDLTVAEKQAELGG